MSAPRRYFYVLPLVLVHFVSREFGMFLGLRYAPPVILVLILAAPGTSVAQQAQVAESFEQLRVLVGQADRVTITLTTGQQIAGRIVTISSSSLALEQMLRDLQEAEVATIRRRRPDPLKNGALWGLGVGVGVGLIAAGIGAGADSGYLDNPGAALGAVVIAAPLCSGLGVAVDAMIQREQVIYRRPGLASAQLAIAPYLDRNRKRIGLSLTISQ